MIYKEASKDMRLCTPEQQYPKCEKGTSVISMCYALGAECPHKD